MNDTIGLAAGIALAVIISIILTKISAKKRKESWSGVVTDIRRYKVQVDETDQEEVMILYRMDTGKKGKLKLNPYAYSQQYSDLKVGDMIIKESGEYFPRKSD